MPSKKQYNLVQNDDYDTRIPLHPEEAFQHGITFQAKFIGTLDVPRPTSRVEIVAAMRRIRYEFKSKGVKKRKVNIEVSVEGVKVGLRKKKKKNQWMDDSKLMLFHHPVYRIFYVSHDSQDLKIFSYIARDGASNVFKCNVFKSNKKSQAMRIVRTVGQAFEVCHKLSINSPPEEDGQDAEDQLIPLDNVSDRDSLASLDKGATRDAPTLLGDPVSCDTLAADSGVLTQLMDSPTDSAPTLSPSVAASPQTPPSQPPPPPLQPQQQQQVPQQQQQQASPRQLRLELAPPPTNNNNTRRSPMSGDESSVAAQHELQMLHEQLEQQAQQTHAAVAQVHLLRDQLAAETAARLEAQARTHQLLVHNKELLEHIQMLVLHLQEMERAQQGGGNNNPQQSVSQQQQQQQPITPNSPRVTMVPQMAVLCDPQTPALAPVYLPDFQEADALRLLPQRANTNQPNPNNPTLYGLNYTNDIMQRLQALYRQPLQPTPTAYYSHQNFRTSPYSGSPVLTHRLMSFPPPEPSPPSISSDQFFRTSPTPPIAPAVTPTSAAADQANANSPFIRPLSQVGTLTTTDNDGRVRVIVPVPADEPSPPAEQVRAGAPQELAAALGLMRVSGGAGPDDFSPGTLRKRAATASPGNSINGPVITRSTSEKVPNRSELMSQVQRTAWARHTTK